MAKKYYWTCVICGTRYRIKGREWRYIYGCRKCHKGRWTTNNKELIKTENFKEKPTKLKFCKDKK